MATIKRFGKEYSYVLECEQNKSTEKLLKFLEDKAPDLFGQLNPKINFEESILTLLKEKLKEAKEGKAKQTIGEFLVTATDLIKKERKREAEATVWFYKLPTLDAQFNKDEEVVFEESTDKDGNKKSISRLIPANEVKKQITIIKNSLVRVEKLFTDDKQPVTWPDNDSQQEEFIAALPHTWRVELADVFRQAATISEEEVKN